MTADMDMDIETILPADQLDDIRMSGGTVYPSTSKTVAATAQLVLAELPGNIAITSTDSGRWIGYVPQFCEFESLAKMVRSACLASREISPPRCKCITELQGELS